MMELGSTPLWQAEGKLDTSLNNLTQVWTAGKIEVAFWKSHESF